MTSAFAFKFNEAASLTLRFHLKYVTWVTWEFRNKHTKLDLTRHFLTGAWCAHSHMHTLDALFIHLSIQLYGKVTHSCSLFTFLVGFHPHHVIHDNASFDFKKWLLTSWNCFDSSYYQVSPQFCYLWSYITTYFWPHLWFFAFSDRWKIRTAQWCAWKCPVSENWRMYSDVIYSETDV